MRYFQKIFFVLLVLVGGFIIREPVFALQHYVKDTLEWMEKACKKNPGGKECRQACGSLGSTDDKWDVALAEKNHCIELTCGKDADKTEKKENYWGNEVEVYTACGILCENISDRHPLCALEKIEKYCQGKGRDESKCAKYCERSGNKHALCQNFSTKTTTPTPVAKTTISTNTVKQEEEINEVSVASEVKIAEPKTDVSVRIIATAESLPVETVQTKPSLIERFKIFWQKMWSW